MGRNTASGVWGSWIWFKDSWGLQQSWGYGVLTFLEHPGTAGSCRRAKNKVEGLQAASSLRTRAKGELRLAPVERVLDLMAAALWLGVQRGLLQEARLQLGLLHGAP